MQLLLFPTEQEADTLLTATEQRAVIQLLLRGASPLVACRSLGLEPLDYCRTARQCEAFQEQLHSVRGLLSWNVAAAVYKSALEGTNAAQALWLRTVAPADFVRTVSDDFTLSDSAQETMADETFDALSEDTMQTQLSAYRRVRSASDSSAHQPAATG